MMRFYFQDKAAGNFATKCIRVSSTATTQDVIETLAEKFRPDMRMLSSPKYSLYEVHVSGGLCTHLGDWWGLSRSPTRVGPWGGPVTAYFPAGASLSGGAGTVWRVCDMSVRDPEGRWRAGVGSAGIR